MMNRLRLAIRHRIAHYLLNRADASFRAAQHQFIHFPDRQSYGCQVGELLMRYGELWLDLATAFAGEPHT